MKKIIGFIMISILLFGCAKNETDVLSKNASFESVTCSITGDIGYMQLDEGNLHNQLVTLIIQNWTICSDDNEDISSEIRRILENEAQSIIESNDMDFDEFINVLDLVDLISVVQDFNTSSFDFEEYLNEFGFSSSLNGKLIGLADVINVSTGTVSEIQNSICLYYQNNKSSLNNDDLTLFGAMTDVAIHSTELWLDTSEGGQNKYFEFQQIQIQICDDESAQQRWWGEIIIADAIGTVTAGAAAAANPLFLVPNPLLGGAPTAGALALLGGVSASAIKAL